MGEARGRERTEKIVTSLLHRSLAYSFDLVRAGKGLSRRFGWDGESQNGNGLVEGTGRAFRALLKLCAGHPWLMALKDLPWWKGEEEEQEEEQEEQEEQEEEEEDEQEQEQK